MSGTGQPRVSSTAASAARRFPPQMDEGACSGDRGAADTSAAMHADAFAVAKPRGQIRDKGPEGGYVSRHMGVGNGEVQECDAGLLGCSALIFESQPLAASCSRAGKRAYRMPPLCRTPHLLREQAARGRVTIASPGAGFPRIQKTSISCLTPPRSTRRACEYQEYPSPASSLPR